jgi:hypothetical protein
MDLRVEIDGVVAVHRRLVGMSDRSVDVSPVMGDVRDIVYESNVQQFDSQGSHGGEPWTRPSDEWTARKIALDLDPRAEQATGDLRKSLTRRRSRGSYSRTRKDGLDLGTTVEYAQYARKRNTLVRLTEAERRQTVKVVQRFIVEEGAGRTTGILAGAL